MGIGVCAPLKNANRGIPRQRNGGRPQRGPLKALDSRGDSLDAMSNVEFDRTESGHRDDCMMALCRSLLTSFDSLEESHYGGSLIRNRQRADKELSPDTDVEKFR